MSKRSRQQHLPRFGCVLLFALSMVAGCGDGVQVTPVSGLVTFRGAPLADGSITFHPENGHPTAVSLDPQGKYQIELPAGEYRVAISLDIKVPEGWKEGDPLPPPPKIVLPPQYSQRARTVLNLTVAPGGEPQTADFSLK